MFLLKIRFICMRIKHDLHINGFTLSLAWKQRLGATRKWPIVLKAILRLRSFPGSYLLVPTEQERPWEQGCHKTWTWCPVDCTMGLSVFHGEIRYHTEQVWGTEPQNSRKGALLYGWLGWLCCGNCSLGSLRKDVFERRTSTVVRPLSFDYALLMQPNLYG